MCPNFSSRLLPSSKTIFGVISVMQRWSVGHDFLWQGEQSSSCRRTTVFSRLDAVYRGSVGPIITATGTFKATAKCRGPVSLVIKSWHRLINGFSNARSTLSGPVLMIWADFLSSISLAILSSPGPTNKRILLCNRLSNNPASSAKYSGGQHLEAPKRAPGFSPITLSFSVIPYCR